MKFTVNSGYNNPDNSSLINLFEVPKSFCFLFSCFMPSLFIITSKSYTGNESCFTVYACLFFNGVTVYIFYLWTCWYKVGQAVLYIWHRGVKSTMLMFLVCICVYMSPGNLGFLTINSVFFFDYLHLFPFHENLNVKNTKVLEIKINKKFIVNYEKLLIDRLILTVVHNIECFISCLNYIVSVNLGFCYYVIYLKYLAIFSNYFL